jgi:hypothetical protein
MVTDDFQHKKRERIQRVLKYLKIDEPFEADIDTDIFYYGTNLSDDEDAKVRNIYKICELVVDKQEEIFIRTGVMVPLKDVMKKAILEESNRLQKKL